MKLIRALLIENLYKAIPTGKGIWQIIHSKCINNLHMQYTDNFQHLKLKKNDWKSFDYFYKFAQNIDCGFTLEPPCRGGSNEYPLSMFWNKNKKNRFTPAYTGLTIHKRGV